MTKRSPNLDDRSFEDLLTEARSWIQRTCPDWNDLSTGDPGMVMLEVFAHLTEVMLYRLNRLPDKAYIAFLDFLGTTMRPPAAASTLLHFERQECGDFLEIPKGTRVQSSISRNGAPPPVFATTKRIVFEPGQMRVEVEARAGEWIEGELLGVATGLPGQTYQIHAPPVVCPVPHAEDLIIAVEVHEQAAERTISWNGQAFEIWNEKKHFANSEGNRRIYTFDRLSGTLSFAPAVVGANNNEPGQLLQLADIPENGQEIRAWYRRGGGSNTNVPAGALSVLKDAISGVSVTNPSTATGGNDEETLENALLRAPQHFRTLDRAVTATDYELLACRGSATIGRAKAFTQSKIWAHAAPGTVELLLVPEVSDTNIFDKGLTAPYLESLQNDDTLKSVQQTIDACQMVGASCEIKWTRYKTVQVHGRVVVRQVEDAKAIQNRLLQCLNRKITALPNSSNKTGWPYGEPLHVSSIYDTLLSEPGVAYVDQIRLAVNDAPDTQVHGLVADAFQKNTWYAGEDEKLFRSTNNGEGWEIIRRFKTGEKIIRVKVHPERAGRIAIITEKSDANSERKDWLIHITNDCGESWDVAGNLKFQVRDCGWIQEGGRDHLLLATDQGLYKLPAASEAVPFPIIVDLDQPTMKLWTVETALSEEGGQLIALAAQDQCGVYLSVNGTGDGAFKKIGLQDEDVRVLQIQRQGPNHYLWAGCYTFGASEGKGCCRLMINRSASEAPHWDHFSTDWRGGSCHGLACSGTHIFAATHHAGVLELNVAERNPIWETPHIECGLGLRDVGRFHPVYAVAAQQGEGHPCMMAGGPIGVFRRRSDSMEYSNVSTVEFNSRVTLPSTWQFCPGKHNIEVVRENEIH